VPVNTIGAILSRARKKLREMAQPSTTSMSALLNPTPNPAKSAAAKPAPSASIKPTKPSKLKPRDGPEPEDKTEVGE
jgi:RNA polymerase sigma-70 factor, ECF subfamily